MRTCPKCDELNGENRTDCWKCKTSLGPVDTYKKKCLKCGSIYPQKIDICEKCQVRLAVWSEDSVADRSGNSEKKGCGLYIAAVLIPLLGIILGCIYIARREDELGKSLIITGITSNLITAILAVVLTSCSTI